MNEYTKPEARKSLEQLRRDLAERMPENPAVAGWASYSQSDEDGIIRECLDRLSKKTGLSKTFVEVGCSNGLENNTHQLILDGYSGVWIDGDTDKIGSIKSALGSTVFPALLVANALVETSNAEELAANASGFLGVDSIDFFSLDIDGNDLHICEPFLKELSPKLVCVEYNAKFPPPTTVVMKYNCDHAWQGDDYFGASLQAWVDYFATHDYVLVCCNLSGANAFFVKTELSGEFASYSTRQLFQPPRYHLTTLQNGHSASLSWIRQILLQGENVATNLDVQPRNQQLVANTEYGSMIVYSGDEIIGKSLRMTGAFQEAKIAEVALFMRQQLDFVPEIFVDIGANIGTHCIYAVRANICKQAIAFEPDPDNFHLLKKNIAINSLSKKIVAFPLALSSKSSPLELERSNFNFGDHRIKPSGNATVSFGEEVERNTLEISAIALDDFAARYRQDWSSAFVWIDTQGHEGYIFKGGTDFFKGKESPRFLVTEFWPYGIERSGSKEQFFKFLESCEWIYDINKDRWQEAGLVSTDDLLATYEVMLEETRKEYHPHTDLLLKIR